MRIQALPIRFSVCKIGEDISVSLKQPFTFVSSTDQELSLVCPTEHVPALTIAREDGWKAFRVEGELDFGLVGILARIASILAENGIPIFAVSTYNTDYILTKEKSFGDALHCLAQAGYEVM